MANSYFTFKQFTVNQDRCAMKVGTDGVLLGAWVYTTNETRILDIGTGTGLIALMLAQRTAAEIYAVEIEKNAYEQALKNFQSSSWGNRIHAVYSSVQDYSVQQHEGFDLIVSNPPFFNNSLKTPEQERNMARHNDVLLPVELLAAVDLLLLPTGRFVVVLPYVDAALFIEDAALIHLYSNKRMIIRSFDQNKPHRLLMEFSRLSTTAEESELVIYNEIGSYTEEYKELTRAFYLAF
jgi:tRNA1Val (adenine37-N6)-methyltransferase